ncbi:MAG: 30S ribosomal protein S20 [Planctomycetes bacterium]|jgi:small subunit ribosomal protein S20|nr:30S ribosomal protein S20 [Planctomycetota bacterium]
MPHTKSAAKNLRKSEKRKAHNRVVKRDVKIQVKALETAITGGGDSVAELTKTYSRLDKAAGKGVIHKKTAARKKSRLAKRLNKAKAAAKA